MAKQNHDEFNTTYDTIDIQESNNGAGKKSIEESLDMTKGKVLPKKDEDTKPDPAVPINMVGIGELFKFAQMKDKILMIFGTLAACIHGAALPMMILVFGNMTDLFIGNADFQKLLRNPDFKRNLTLCGSLCNNITIENIRDNPPLLCMYQIQLGVNCSQIFGNVQNSLLSEMRKYALYYALIGIGVLIIAYFQISFWMTAAYRQTQLIRTAFFKAILRQEIGWFDTHEVGELNTRLSDDINKIQDGIGDKLAMFFQFFCAFLAGIILGFVNGWKLTLVILSVSPLIAGSAFMMSKIGAHLTNRELKSYAKAGAVAEEVLGAFRTVVAFGGEQKECIRYNENLEDAKVFGIKKGFVNGAAVGLLFLIMFSSYGLAFFYGSKLIREGEYTAGKLLVVFFSVLIGAFSIGNAAPNLQNLATARGAAYEIFKIIDQEPLINSESNEGHCPQVLIGNISFEKVFFNYPSREDVAILNGLSLSIEVGKTVALVGSSGCGKSTVIQLLQRFYDPKNGRILIDGVDISQLNIKWLRQHIGVVSQEPILFGTTISENIRYGRENVTMDEIIQASKHANAYDFILKLPMQFETLVGERGAQLSGGQKQRVAIARALVRNPKILLLDEATSALDTESESIVQEALDEARKGRTTIVVAHRLSTIKTADLIVSIKNGTVAEFGTHHELMKIENGIYYNLVMTQTRMNKAAKDEESSDEDEEELLKRKETTKLQRLRSISSSISIQSNKELEEENLPEASFGRIMNMNLPELPFIILGCFGALISGAIQPSFAIIFAEILGVFSKPINEQEKQANMFSGLFVAIGGVAALAMILQSFSFSKSGEMLTWRIRKRAFECYMRQEVGYYDKKENNLGALTTRLASDASAVQGATGARMGTIIQSFCSIVTGLVIGFIFSWKLSLLICAFAPFMMIGGFIQMKVMTGSARNDKEALENAGKTAVETIENIRTVATLTKEEHFFNDYVKMTEIPLSKNLKKAHIQGIAYSFSQSIVFFAYAACFVFGAYLIEKDGLEYQNMFKVISAIVFGAMAVGQASSFAPDYGKAKLSAAKLFQLFDRQSEIDSFNTEGKMLNQVTGEISFVDCKFNYPTRPDIQVLQGLNVNVHPGQTVALVGSSGCGKSTTVQLIERFYDPMSGLVKFDGDDTRNYNIQWLRKQIGLVQQEPILFDATIKENIAYGDNSRTVDMDEIIDAAKNANIHNFINSLPLQYDTNVGDKGAQLSGGQKQRIAIARALIRKPRILLLDEATSALDTESEQIVQDALDKARLGRTSIVIAHRLSTIHNADQIAVIQHGKVIEIGTHEELMKLQGRYYKLNRTQTKKK